MKYLTALVAGLVLASLAIAQSPPQAPKPPQAPTIAGWTEQQLNEVIDARVDKRVDELVAKAFEAHAKAPAKAATPLPKDPRVCTHCECGCTTTGQCTCVDCDHPKLGNAAVDSTQPGVYHRIIRDGVAGPWIAGPSTSNTGVCTINPDGTYNCPAGTSCGQQSMSSSDPLYQSFMSGDSGSCANGSCGSSSSSGRGLFRRGR